MDDNKKTTLRDVTNFIRENAGKLTLTDLDSIGMEMDIARKRVRNNAVAQFRINDIVTFISSKHGRSVRGRVTKINSSTIHVQEIDNVMKWRVSPELLKLAEPKSGGIVKT